jgi:hypothetical protein
MAPSILSIGTGWRSVVSFTSGPLYPGGKSSGAHWREDWVGPSAGLNCVARGEISTPAAKRTSIPRSSILQPSQFIQ